jgi:hypothetical protein
MHSAARPSLSEKMTLRSAILLTLGTISIEQAKVRISMRSGRVEGQENREP